MELNKFQNLIETSTTFQALTLPLKALWFDQNNDWKLAHSYVADEKSPEAAWVHAYLHRKEGDEENARYWYAKAGKKFTNKSLDEEWLQITKSLLKNDIPLLV